MQRDIPQSRAMSGQCKNSYTVCDMQYVRDALVRLNQRLHPTKDFHQ